DEHRIRAGVLDLQLVDASGLHHLHLAFGQRLLQGERDGTRGALPVHEIDGEIGMHVGPRDAHTLFGERGPARAADGCQCSRCKRCDRPRAHVPSLSKEPTRAGRVGTRLFWPLFDEAAAKARSICGRTMSPWPRARAPLRSVGGLTEVNGRCASHHARRERARRRDATPVEPKPPAPRAVVLVRDASMSTTRSTRCTTSWAMRSPRATVNGSVPRLASSTFTSPR